MVSPFSKQLAELLRAAEASVEPVIEVELPEGARLRCRKSVSPTVKVQIESIAVDGTATVITRVFHPAAARPADYPPTAAFLAHHETTVAETPQAILTTWEAVADPNSTLQALLDASTADGWEAEPGAPSLAGAEKMGIRIRALRRGGLRRQFTATVWPAPSLICMDLPDSKQPAAVQR